MSNILYIIYFISLCLVNLRITSAEKVTATEVKDSTDFPIILFPGLMGTGKPKPLRPNKPLKPNKPSLVGNEIANNNNPSCMEESLQSENIRIALFSKPNYRGEGATLEISPKKCKNIPNVFKKGIVRSIDTLGSCLLLYDQENCEQSKYLEQTIVYRHEIFATNLSTISPYFTLESIELCNNENVFYEITLYEHAFFYGRRITFYLLGNGECYDLESDFNDMSSSFTTNQPGTCIILWSEPKCRGIPSRLYGDSYGAEDFEQINFDNEASSAQLCSGVDINDFAKIPFEIS